MSRKNAEEPLVWNLIDSPCGPLLLVVEADGAVVRIEFAKGRTAQQMRLGAESDPSLIDENPQALQPLLEQLAAYFAGRLQDFELRLRPRGTDFQKEVWQALSTIPYGETTTYGELAARLGRPKASRAIGRANGTNPIPIVVPCHRVIGADGSLTGFGGGLPTKALLLELEGVSIPRQLRLM